MVTTEILPEVLEDRVLTMPASKETETEVCGYCNKPVDRNAGYRSPGGYLYCTHRHFVLFTED